MADSPPRRHSSGSGSGRRGSIYRSSQVFNRLDSRNYALPLGVPEKSTQIEQQEELVKNLNTYYIQCKDGNWGGGGGGGNNKESLK